MRKVGFSREKSGAVEVASSVNGQIMPPVMGAAAFLMVEYVGVSYIEVVKAAFIPAVISYIALLYLVHLEALKRGMKVIPKEDKSTMLQTALASGITVSSMLILSAIVYYFVSFVKYLCGEDAVFYVVGSVILSYIGLLYYAAKYPPLEMDNPHAKIVKLPKAKEVLRTGPALHITDCNTDMVFDD